MEHSPRKRRKTSPPASHAKDTEKRPRIQDRKQTSERRASFMSPTKASLAKFNPNLLQKVASEPRRQSRIQNGKEKDIRLFTPLSESKSKFVPAKTSPRRVIELNDVTNGDKRPGLSENSSHRRQSTAISKLGLSKQDDGIYDQNQDGLGEKDVAEVAGIETSLLTPKRRVALPGDATQENDEPSLPSTPSQLGLEAPAERPKGLLFGTPSRRPKKKTASSSNSNGPSPLKHNAETTNRVTEPAPFLDLGPRIWLPGEPEPPLSATQVELQHLQRDKTLVEKEILETSAPVLKDVILSRWLKSGARSRKVLARKRKKISLLVETFAQINERLEDLGLSVGNHAVSSTSSELLGLNGNLQGSSKPVNGLAERLCLFLPFSGTAANPTSSVPPTSTTNTDANGPAQYDDQASPCTVQIRQSRILPLTTEGLLPQRHEVTFCSISEPALQLAKILLTIDSKSLCILRVKPLSIHPWPKYELHAFMRTNSLSGKPPTILGTAIGRYWQVIQLRTHCWKSVRERFPHLDVSRNYNSAIGQGTADPANNNDDDDGRTTKVTIKRADHPAVALSIEWTITFDEETGDVQSRVFASAEFPPSWRRGDEELGLEEEPGVLDRVGEAFDALVRRRGVTAAVEVIVALLFPFD